MPPEPDLPPNGATLQYAEFEQRVHEARQQHSEIPSKRLLVGAIYREGGTDGPEVLAVLPHNASRSFNSLRLPQSLLYNKQTLQEGTGLLLQRTLGISPESVIQHHYLDPAPLQFSTPTYNRAYFPMAVQVKPETTVPVTSKYFRTLSWLAIPLADHLVSTDDHQRSKVYAHCRAFILTQMQIDNPGIQE